MPNRLIQDGELVLYGTVGVSDQFFGEEGFTATEVLDALTELNGNITVRLNSGGGFASEGVTIYNALKARPTGDVTVSVDGIAASAASVIAMAGDEIIMRDGALMMIHNASALTVGTKKDHEKSVEVLDKTDGSLATIYARRSGNSTQKVRKLMDAVTWFSADEAVINGFATGADSTNADEPAAFDYRIYANAPQRLVAMAESKFNARNSARSEGGDARREQSRKENRMTDTTKSGQDKPADLKALTVEQITAANPQLVAQLEAGGVEKAKAAADAKAKADAETRAKGGETPEDMEKRIRAALAERSKDIAAACGMAGMADKAPEFMASDKSVSQVLAELQKLRAEGKGGDVNARHSGNRGGGDNAASAALAKHVERANARLTQ